jgi:VanZ family protein
MDAFNTSSASSGDVPVLNPRLRRTWAVAGWALVSLTITLSLRPLPASLAVDHLDKLAHALTYAALTLWFIQIAPAPRWVRIAIRFMCMGVLIEIAQGQTGYRQFSFVDMLANGTGIAGALLAAHCGLSTLLARWEAVLARAR